MTVLIIEDEPVVRDLMELLLLRNGHEVLTAGERRMAENIWAQEQERIDVVVCKGDEDLQGGADLCRRFKAEKPGARVILCGGEGRAEGGFELLPRLFNSHRLVEAVERPGNPVGI